MTTDRHYLINVWSLGGSSWRVSVCPPQGRLITNEAVFGSPVDACIAAGAMIKRRQLEEQANPQPGDTKE